MKTGHILTRLLVSLVGLVQALPAQDAAASETTSFGLTWTGMVKPDEPVMSFTGTAEEIYNSILSHNPNYDIELGIHSPNSTFSMPSGMMQEEAVLDKRAPTSSDYTCGYGTYVNGLNIAAGVKYLYNIGNGDCAAGPGRPGAGGCSRTTCSSDAAIWLCNDNNFELHIPCFLVADNAVEVLVKCHYWDGATNHVRGQIFSMDRTWNTIINRC